MYLSDKKIISIIDRYVKDNRYNQAILIDGDWGSGKTFFIKEKLIPKLNKTFENKKTLYISLYGMSDINQITDEIYLTATEKFFNNKFSKKKIFKNNENIGENITKGTNIVTKILTAGMKYINIDLKDLPTLQDLIELKNAIIIFDDLERCSIDINQTLGYINNLTEHNSIKIIIVSNESEIATTKFCDDLPQKYLVALNSRIDFKDNLNSNNNCDADVNLEKLQEYTKLLFAKDSIYEEIKEKLIGMTIKYQASISDIYNDVIKKYIKGKKIKSFLLANKEIIVSTFENHNHKNIRTLIFALISFETIYNIVSKLEFEPTEILDRQLQNILNYLIEIAIRLKCNQELYCWKEINKPAAKIFSKYEDIFGNNMWGYKFVDTYLMTQFIDEDEIKDIMFDVLNEVKKEEDNKYLLNSYSITELSNWTHLEDERIKSLINTIVMEIKENKYPPLYFKNLIGLLMQLEDAGFEISYDEVIPSMQSYLKNSKETVTVDDLSIFGSDYNTTKKYKSITKPLIDIVIRKDVESKKIINDCLNLTKLWGKTFAENCKNNREGYLLDKKFFYYLDVKKIIEKLSISTVEDVYDFISGINTIYNFSNLSEFFRNDIEKITLFLKLLDIESLSSSKITKKIALTTLKSKLEKIKKTIES